MVVEGDEDRLAFLGDFGVEVSWAVGAAVSGGIMGLFDSGTIVEPLQGGPGALNTRATLTMREADIPAGAGDAADTVTVGGANYHPKAIMPDGQGMAVVTLEAA